ncbi:MAG TPA: WYL domain-containing protein [Syntrophomonadaceae bacterium]|nr:WYL domain-containing protein [Syntrophomonadaceae bacterium]
MTRYPRTGTQPETLMKMLITVIEKTPSGGATMEDLQDAYAEINDWRPSVRTIYRYIRRLNLFFDPLCYGEKPEPGEEPDEDDTDEAVTVIGEKAVCSIRRGRKTYYIFRGKKGNLPASAHDTTMLLLGMYPQLRGAMKSSIEAAMQSIFRNSLSGLSTFASILSELEHVVHVSGAFPADPEKSEAMIREILRAIREKKRVRLSYLRTYDGAVTERVVEPHGLLCRLNNWYLTGQCTKRQQRRVFLLLNIKDLAVIENSFYRMPPGFSLKEAYQDIWGTWTDDEAGDLETVRLKVCAGPAERFRHNLFHESQGIREFPDGGIEVTYRLAGAQEMIPWLMSWGGAVEVLEPAWLREQLISSLQETLRCYL